MSMLCSESAIIKEVVFEIYAALRNISEDQAIVTC